MTADAHPHPAPQHRKSSFNRHCLFALAFAAAFIAAHAVIRPQLPTALRYVLPAVCLALGIKFFWHMARQTAEQADELQRRVYLEAGIVTCVVCFVLLLVYPLFERTGVLGPLDPYIALGALTFTFVAAFTAAQRKYQ